MGELKDRLRADMTAAMRARDAATTSVLRMALAAVTTAEVAGEAARELSADEELAVITKEVASRRDSAQAYTDGNRPELAAKELGEAEVLQRYLPAPLSEDEVVAIVDDAVAQVRAAAGDVSMRKMGDVMRIANAEVRGRADGAWVAALVKARLMAS